jgi:TonB-linked SusC/RagA family outer membrane protein
MMIKKITIQLICLVVLSSLSQMLYTQVITDESGEYPDSTLLLNTNEDLVNLTFYNISSRNITSPVIVIDVEKELQRDQRTNLSDIINGKVPGVFGSYNTWGTGNSVILVDGIPQGSFYLNSLSMLEIESVVILKDALSKAMYGAQGDNGVILVNTKRGKAGQNKLRVIGEFGGVTPRALPDYLGAADYMEKYTEAQMNDYIASKSDKGFIPTFSPDDIADTRSGVNPIRYPDNDFYTSEYIKNYTTDAEVFADVSGGNKDVRYYVNTGWKQSNGWLNTPQPDITNRLNFRGNLDFNINEYMDMSLDATARLSFNAQPNAGNFWSMAANEVPNHYPVLWDPNLITSDVERDLILSQANLVNGKLLGAMEGDQSNVFGNYVQNGIKKYMERDIQFSGKLNLDMSFLTKGLSASMYGGMNFYNSLYSSQDPDYAVYVPHFDDVVVDSLSAEKVGIDKAANKYNVSNGNSDFFRRISYYGTLNYDRTFGDHAISANAVVYNNMLTLEDELQKNVVFHTGISANYLFKKKYAAEATLMGIGSRKLMEGQRMEMAPSFGLGWILSEENFMADVSFIDYLKIRTTYGISKNDDWDDYYAYKGTFTNSENPSFYYQNRISRNKETVFTSWPNDIFLQSRKDLTVGFDASFLSRSLNLSFSYFNSESIGNITTMSNTYPQILGFAPLFKQNYNNDMTQGAEVGLNYTYKVNNELSITAGSNLLFVSPKITKKEEAFYEGLDADYMREGTPTDAMWGLKTDGLYSEADFTTDGHLIDGLPVPSFGTVYPGDIKYLDQNGDQIIDFLDNRIIGHSMRTQYSVFVDVKFRNIEFYAIGIGQLGDYNYRSGSYFRVFGNAKYSEMVNDAYNYDLDNTDAIHPRLTTTDGAHNDRSSDYWIYKNNTFVIPTMQLTYHFDGIGKTEFIKNSRVYLRANNMVITGKNKKYTEINPGGSPRTMGMSVGLVTSF